MRRAVERGERGRAHGGGARGGVGEQRRRVRWCQRSGAGRRGAAGGRREPRPCVRSVARLHAMACLLEASRAFCSSGTRRSRAAPVTIASTSSPAPTPVFLAWGLPCRSVFTSQRLPPRRARRRQRWPRPPPLSARAHLLGAATAGLAPATYCHWLLVGLAQAPARRDARRRRVRRRPPPRALDDLDPAWPARRVPGPGGRLGGRGPRARRGAPGRVPAIARAAPGPRRRRARGRGVRFRFQGGRGRAAVPQRHARERRHVRGHGSIPHVPALAAGGRGARGPAGVRAVVRRGELPAAGGAAGRSVVRGGARPGLVYFEFLPLDDDAYDDAYDDDGSDEAPGAGSSSTKLSTTTSLGERVVALADVRPWSPTSPW